MSIIGILAVIFTFGVAILAHEFGHFLCAKLLGVGVETFSIGMGKKLIKIKKGETTYCISAIPFGGYVVLKGS
ncbi:site-2 protease family protein, partial [Candidatus Sumerlaeota bacterium]|nr:site-2 protease family protein [Candidatus Sumerlaeota bacterium]